MTYKIEKNVPMPGPSKYPLVDMKIGDSFATSRGDFQGVRGAIQKLQKASKLRFVTRQDGECIRVWRSK
jgi:hypothetical protein